MTADGKRNRIDYIKRMIYNPLFNIDEHISQSDSLDDEQRVKMLSPTMLVAKGL